MNERQIGKKYTTYKENAAKRGRSFSLTIGEFVAICEQPCHYCGAAPLRGGSNRWAHNGVDRKNNKSGYWLGNCLPCCSICNAGKGQREYRVFVRYIEHIRGGKGQCAKPS